MKIAGLTGGIATGKSAVARMFEELGARIVDADAVAREIVLPGTPAYNDIVVYFGTGILAPDDTIDREKLGGIIFNDEEDRAALNRFTHLRVLDAMQDRIQRHEKEGAIAVICDIPLLFESGAHHWLKPVILVYADPDAQLARLMERDKCSRERAMARITSQMPIEEKKKLADMVIDNSGSMEATRVQAAELWEKYLGAKS